MIKINAAWNSHEETTQLTLNVLRLPHSSRFFVVGLQMFRRGRVGLKFVGPSACRTLADFLSRLTALRLGAESCKVKMAPIPHDAPLITFPNWSRRGRALTNCLVHLTLADKARQDVLRSSTVRYRPTSLAPILSQTCLNSPQTSRQGKVFCRPTKSRVVCSGL